MSKIKFNPTTLVLAAIIALVTAFRLLVVFNTDILVVANFSSIGAVALFGGAYFKNNLKAFAFPLLSLFLSDFILANTLFKPYSNGSFLYPNWYYTYIALAMMVVVAKVLMTKVNIFSFLGSTLVVVFIHWIVTDFGVWFLNPEYPQTLAGFWFCLVKAIPFEFRFMSGTLMYGAVIFGAYEILKVKVLSLQTQKK
ncbi:MAG: hypothetical protein K2Q03_10590 [Sphingobacteriaceae bacterium]|nr:hypothetical protein [Sphingobacteriaceae bacterium]